jgi:long-chain acyl-CoA synthetase
MEKIWLRSYQEGVPAEINPDAYSSLCELFFRSCEKFADKPAITNLGTTITYREVARLSQAFAAYCQQELKLQKGDRLAIMLPNILQYHVVLFGALLAGLVVVNVNPLYTTRELTHQLRDSGAQTIVVLANFAHVVKETLPSTSIKHVIVTQLGDLLSWPKSWIVNFVVKYIKKMVKWNIVISNAMTFNSVLAKGKKLVFQSVPLNGNDIAFLQYTGGTTGVAKGAILTHRNMVANIEQVKAWAKPIIIEGKEIVITALPMYHIFSLTANCLTFFCFGANNILITNPRDIPHFVSELKGVRFTTITGVNTLFNALLHNPEFQELDFSDLKITLGGGAAIQSSVAETWQKITGKVMFEGYGLTETSPAVCISPMNLTAFNNSVGLPLPSTDIRICNENGEEVPLGERGELWVKGPQVCKGYWQHPEETRLTIHEGWFKTGDIVVMNDKGYITIVDRKKDMLLVSGFNVYPNEIEDVIASHPGVFEVAVIGVPSPSTGEAVKAIIVKKDPKLTAQDIQEFCRKQLAGYKRPAIIEFRDSLPKSNIGKVIRRLLREESEVR